MKLRLPQIISAENDILVDDSGHRVIDLFSAHGTTFLGHCNRKIAAELTEQLQQVWITGGFASPAYERGKAAIESIFPPSHGLAGLYSTGMEAAEFAIRIARGQTGRNGVMGFARSMHGKSMATAYLGWDNGDGLSLPPLGRMTFVSDQSEADVLGRLNQALEDGRLSAVFVEPIQGSGGGHQASSAFYEQLIRLCRRRGTLSVFDEIMTGFYRTGEPFLHTGLAEMPDLVLIGKAMGNGFPVSGVMVHRDIQITQNMLPGSTFAGNPLAATAVAATLKQMSVMDLPANVRAIERVILDSLPELKDAGIMLRGRGAMWIIEVPESVDVESVVAECYRKGAFVSFAGRFIRILPAATIDPEHLQTACRILRQQLLAAANG